jgi:outer membrane protein OmpA-like peptidoglycan-associated protein
MLRAPLGPVVLALLAVGAVAACGPRRVAQPSGPSQTLVVLLPDDPKTEVQSKATVSNPTAGVELSHARDATNVAANRAPTPPAPMTEAEIQKMFGATPSHLPPSVEHFNLYFLFESDELTETSRAVLPTVLSAVRERAVPEVTVIGHTDTMGDKKSNYELGLKRATTVRAMLVAAGLDPSLVEVASHGEGDLLFPTPDETADSRNRRVEITIR